MLKKIQILFLLLIGAYPPLFLYAHNQGELSAISLVIPLILSAGIPIMIAISWYPITRNMTQAALVGAWSGISFWIAGYVGNNILFEYSTGGTAAGITVIILFFVLYFIGRIFIITKPDISKIASVIGMLSGVLIIYSLILIMPTETHRMWRNITGKHHQEASLINIKSDRSISELPNIIDIVLDGYARADVLATRYHQSNEQFINDLKARGFMVLDKSKTNYNATALSLTSILNMKYIKKPERYIGNDSDYITNLIHNNAALDFLSDKGYKTVTFRSGSTLTDGILSDEMISYSETMDQYQIRLMEFTPISILMNNWLRNTTNDPYEIHRRRVSNSLSGLSGINDRSKPLYIFAHVICPHPPFIYNADGSATSNNKRFNMWDADNFIAEGGTKDEYINGYKNQVTYLNKLTIKAIDRINSKMKRPTVIILHSDHGPGLGLDFKDANKSDLGERMSNLMAIKFPDGNYKELYPEITGVNIYRVILNKYLGTELPLLPDEHYFAHWNNPLDQIKLSADQIENFNIKAKTSGIIK